MVAAFIHRRTTTSTSGERLLASTLHQLVCCGWLCLPPKASTVKASMEAAVLRMELQPLSSLLVR